VDWTVEVGGSGEQVGAM